MVLDRCQDSAASLARYCELPRLRGPESQNGSRCPINHAPTPVTVNKAGAVVLFEGIPGRVTWVKTLKMRFIATDADPGIAFIHSFTVGGVAANLILILLPEFVSGFGPITMDSLSYFGWPFFDSRALSI